MHVCAYPLAQQLQAAPGALVQEAQCDVKGGAAPHLQGALSTGWEGGGEGGNAAGSVADALAARKSVTGGAAPQP